MADVHDGTLVDAGSLVRSDELLKRVAPKLAGVLLDEDPVGGHRRHDPGGAGEEHLARVLGRATLHAGATIGASGSRSGTAWRCMFEPIRARFASSCSRLSLIHISEPTRLGMISYAVF